MSIGIDPAAERTPQSVAAMRLFKDKLLAGHNVKAAQFGLTLPTMTTQPLESYDVPQTIISDDQDDFEKPEVIDTPPYVLHTPRATGKTQDVARMLAEFLETAPALEDVKITGPFGKLGFKAVNVSITDVGVAFIIKKDALHFEPVINSELTIHYKGREYLVVYAGGFFTFPSIPITFVSFLRILS